MRKTFLMVMVLFFTTACVHNAEVARRSQVSEYPKSVKQVSARPTPVKSAAIKSPSAKPSASPPPSLKKWRGTISVLNEDGGLSAVSVGQFHFKALPYAASLHERQLIVRVGYVPKGTSYILTIPVKTKAGVVVNHAGIASRMQVLPDRIGRFTAQVPATFSERSSMFLLKQDAPRKRGVK